MREGGGPTSWEALRDRGFLPSRLYRSGPVADRERRLWQGSFWHPVAASCELGEDQVLALEAADLPLLVVRPAAEPPRAFLNRCPHRGVAFLEPTGGGALERGGARPCRRLVCPYHGWTYGLDGRLRAAAREEGFGSGFDRADWPLQPVACREFAGFLWVAGGPTPIRLEEQLDLVLEEAGPRLLPSRSLLAVHGESLACDWKLAHDNTLDDYHVAIAHPATLHRQQGPVRHYRHRLGRWSNLLATPSAQGEDGEEFLTFGFPPWHHLLLWPDSRLALLGFPPQGPGRCRIELRLLGEPDLLGQGTALLEELLAFLREDRVLVESAQRAYGSAPAAGTPNGERRGEGNLPGGEGFRPGPPHNLEQRILHHQALYAEVMGVETGAVPSPWEEGESNSSGRIPR